MKEVGTGKACAQGHTHVVVGRLIRVLVLTSPPSVAKADFFFILSDGWIIGGRCIDLRRDCRGKSRTKTIEGGKLLIFGQRKHGTLDGLLRCGYLPLLAAVQAADGASERHGPDSHGSW